MANFLVTGGAGFIGSNLVKGLLARGHCVRVLDNFSTGRRANLAGMEQQIELLVGSICDPEILQTAMTDIDFVLHHAAIPSVPLSIRDPRQNLEVGAMGTTMVLQAAREARVKRVVYASSSAVYGDHPGEFKLETMTPQPLSPYAIAKLTGEYLCSVFTHCYGLQTVSLRYFNVFGPKQDPQSEYSAVVPKFISAILQGEQPTIFGDGYQTRDFINVENVVRANILAAESEKGSGMVFNIACGEAFNLHDLLRAIGRVLGVEVKPKIAPPRVGEVIHSKADISLGREVLGYRIEVPFEEGIRKTVEWYQSVSSTR